jgi:hypothetical protein
MTRRALGWLALIATALICVHAYLATQLFADEHQPIFYGASVEVALYALAALVVLRDRGEDVAATRRATVFILVSAGVLRLMLIPADPVSTDINRYIWDGRVQAAGINPYAYIPADPALKFLRDDDIFPEINRADYAPTIYPPLAQIVFYLVTRVAETITVMKTAMVLFELVGVWAIMRLLAMRGIKSSRILLYAWHPLPIWEFAGSGHVDAIALACVMLAVLAAESRKPLLAGVALGGAALVKFFPVVIAPALYRRWDWRAPLAGLATIVLLYLPYIGAGQKIFGFLGGYSDEEGLRDGTGLYPFALLRSLLPVPESAIVFYMPVAAAILGVAGLAVLFRDRLPGFVIGARGRGVTNIGGAFLLVILYTVLTSPHFAWYFAWAIPFLCFVPYWPMFYLTGSSTLLYIAGWPPSLLGGSIFYLPFAVFVAIDLAIRVAHVKEKRHGHPVVARTLG